MKHALQWTSFNPFKMHNLLIAAEQGILQLHTVSIPRRHTFQLEASNSSVRNTI